MTLTYTPHFHLAIPDFLSEPWHSEFATAMQSIDDALYSVVTGNVPAPVPVGFSAHKNGVDQTGFPHATITKVTFGTELYDLGPFYDTTLSRWTPPSGIVSISAGIHVPVTVLTPGHTNVYIYKNGVAFKTTFGQNVGIEGITSITISDKASGTDFYEVFVSSPSGSTYMVAGGTTVSWFMGHVVQKV